MKTDKKGRGRSILGTFTITRRMSVPFCDISGTKIGKEIIGATKSHKNCPKHDFNS